jgi:hypothetical protein
MIVIVCCPNTNGLQFYNLVNGTFVSSIDYKLQPNIASGACFGYQYQPGTVIHRLDESTSVYAPKFTLDSTFVPPTHSPPQMVKVMIIPLYDQSNIYTVAFNDGSIAEYSDSNNILEACPAYNVTSPCSLLTVMG